MQEAVLVTVICSCYNHQDFVAQSLKSVLNQTYQNIQIIVIDDSSKDNSVEEIEKFTKTNSEIIFIKNKSNLGLTKSVTNAMNYAKGYYFIDLAADDILLPNCIEIQLETYKNSRYKNLAIVYGNAQLITKEGNHSSYYFDVNSDLKTKNKRPSGDLYINIISHETTICSVSAMYKKEVFDKLNGYDTNLTYEDFDYWIRASRAHQIEFIDSVLVQKRILPNSLHTTLHQKKNKNSYSTFIILKKAFELNKNRNEHRILIKRVNFEIMNSFKTSNYILMLKNMHLRFLITLKTL